MMRAESGGKSAWRTFPSWVMVVGRLAVVRFMAERASSRSAEFHGTHAVLVPQPQAATAS
ncbi:hypothetical protein BIV25_43005 [Streptomyces sp. MUSC 14]|nr:hypothetical protein BIV25_43005 [Streptomyces sp. MUSC 14]